MYVSSWTLLETHWIKTLGQRAQKSVFLVHAPSLHLHSTICPSYLKLLDSHSVEPFQTASGEPQALLPPENLNTQNGGLYVAGALIKCAHKETDWLTWTCRWQLSEKCHKHVDLHDICVYLLLPAWKACTSVGIYIHIWPKMTSRAGPRQQHCVRSLRLSALVGLTMLREKHPSTGLPFPPSRLLPHSVGIKKPSPTLCLSLSGPLK